MSPGAISRVVVADKISLVRRMLDGIHSLPLDTLTAFRTDPRMVAAGDSYLRRALEALLDLARHVLAKGFARAPAEYAEIGQQLGEVGVVDSGLAAKLVVMARYRNRMVHFYDEISDEELFSILTGKLGDIEDVISNVTRWLEANPDRVGRDGSNVP
jgi:uncharacterized protein YutE (UPF0331/DUF86 family)